MSKSLAVSNTLKALRVLAEFLKFLISVADILEDLQQRAKIPSSPPSLPTSLELALASSPHLREHRGLHQPFGFLGAGVYGPEALEGQVRLPGPFEDRRASPSSSCSSSRC